MTEDTTTSPRTPAPSPGPVPPASASTVASSFVAVPHNRDVGQITITDEVTVRMPADGAYLSVLRTATAGLAARLDFTLDDIEDMRIAVDEACAMLLSQAIPGSSLECNFALSPDDMTVTVSVPSLDPRPPSADTFAWTVLSALAGAVEAHAGPADRLTVKMRKRRRDPGPV